MYLRTLTVRDVRLAVQIIKNEAHPDSGLAHQHEDELYESVLTAIAEGRCRSPKALAKEAIKSKDIDMSRWYD